MTTRLTGGITTRLRILSRHSSILAALLLGGCALFDKPPTVFETRIKTVEVPVFIPLDDKLLVRCTVPPFTGTTYGDAVEYVLVLKGEMGACDARIEAIIDLTSRTNDEK